MTFAATYFAPLSALSRQTWMAAKVSFHDLDRAVGQGPIRGAWKTYLGSRTGEVSFDYAVVHCLRPWYTPALYQADDWKITPDGSIVSKGNGTDGELVAWVDAVYLVSVTDITIRPMPRPKPEPRLPTRVLVNPRLASSAEIRLERPVVRSKSIDVAGPRLGVVIGTKAPPSGPTSARVAGTVLSSDAANARFTALSSGAVRRLTAIDMSQRYAVALSYLRKRRPTEVSLPPEDTSIYVTGFGCTKIPFAPNPNPNYDWS